MLTDPLCILNFKKSDGENMRLLTSLFLVDYAQIDPNVSHKENELINSGHMIFASDKKQGLRNEARDLMGVDVVVQTYSYDYEKIKVSLKMEMKPESHLLCNDFALFHNHTEGKTVSIPSHISYTNHRKNDICSVVYAERVVEFSDYGGLYNVILEELFKERQICVNYGDIYRLSNSMIKLIGQKMGCQWLSKYCGDEPKLFVIFHEEN
jgi:hypothetical protein